MDHLDDGCMQKGRQRFQFVAEGSPSIGKVPFFVHGLSLTSKFKSGFFRVFLDSPWTGAMYSFNAKNI